MGKASRRKREPSAEAAPCEIRKDNPGTFLRTFKSKVLACTLAAVTLIGSFELAKEHNLIHVSDTGPKYFLNVVFLEHTGVDHATKVLNEIDLAAKQGKPYKIMFMEDAFSKSSNYEEKAVADNNLFKSINDHYISLLNSGLSPKEAEQRCRIDVNINTDDFRKTLIIGCAIRGIKFMAIEAHSEEGSKKSVGFVSDLNAPGKPSLQDLLSNNVPLNILAQYNLDVDKQTVESTILRDHDIVSGLSKRFDQAIKLFPELGTAQEVRAIGLLGIAHEPIYYEFDHSNKRLSFTKEEYVDWDSILQRVFVENQKDDTKPITMRQAELISIDQIWSMPQMTQLKATNPTIVMKAINEIMKMRQDQLEQLDCESKETNVNDRGRYLLRGVVDTSRSGHM
jgi:hypothetical protein